MGIFQRRNAHRHWKVSSVLRNSNGFQPFDGLALPQSADNMVLFVQAIRREQHGHRFAYNFFWPITEKPLRTRIPCLNYAIEILGENRVPRMFDHGGEMRGCLLSFVLLSHVAKN